MSNVKIAAMAYWGEYDKYLSVEKSIEAVEHSYQKAGNEHYITHLFSKTGHGILVGEEAMELTSKISFPPELFSKVSQFILDSNTN